MTSTELRRVSSLNNKKNMKLMEQEAVEAKNNGITYGMLKANLGPSFEESEYPVNTQQYVTRTVKTEGSKAVARIK